MSVCCSLGAIIVHIDSFKSGSDWRSEARQNLAIAVHGLRLWAGMASASQ